MTTQTAVAARIILVDDHPLVRAAVSQALSSPDIAIVGEAGNYRDALEMTERLRPDLVLLDLDLPGRSGLEFLRDIRPRYPDARVVVLTVSAADRDLLEAVRLGAAGYLTKDITGDALLTAVRAAQRGELLLPDRLAAAASGHVAGDAARIGQLTDRVAAFQEHLDHAQPVGVRQCLQAFRRLLQCVQRC